MCLDFGKSYRIFRACFGKIEGKQTDLKKLAQAAFLIVQRPTLQNSTSNNFQNSSQNFNGHFPFQYFIGKETLTVLTCFALRKIGGGGNMFWVAMFALKCFVLFSVDMFCVDMYCVVFC